MAAWGALVVWTLAVRADAAPIGAPVGADTSFPIGFEWDREAGAETCIAEDSLRRSVEALLQRRIFAPLEQTAVVIRGRVAPTSNLQRYRARLALVVGDGSVVGERVLDSESSDCASLNQPLTLVIALAIDSLRALPKSTLRLDAKSRWFGEVALSASYERGLLPAPAPGFGVGATLQPPSFWPIELGVTWWPFPTSVQVPSGPGAEVMALAGHLGFCPWLAQGPSLGLRLCAGVQGGRFVAKGVSVDISRSPSTWMIGAGARLALWIPLGRRLALQPSVGAVVPFVQYRFTYTDETRQEQTVYRAPPIALVLELAVPVRIP